MQNLWAPWRSEYVLGQAEAEGSGVGPVCVFCSMLERASADDSTDLVLVTGEHALVVLNRYPYNNGHLLVAPRRHTADLQSLSPLASLALWELVRRTVAALESALHPEGINLGINLGRVAGAGIADHLHVHVVPRWSGDTNFMATLAETKVISQHLRTTFEQLKPHFEGIA